MKKTLEIEVKVGIFVVAGLALTALAILIMGSSESFTTSKVRYQTHFPSVEGLVPGAKVLLGGVQVGTVQEIELDTTQHNVKVSYSVTKQNSGWVKSDSYAEIATLGMLGDKYVSIAMGGAEATTLTENSEIPYRAGKDITQFLSKGDQLIVSLNGIATNLNEVLKSLRTNNRSDHIFEGFAKTSQNMAVVTSQLKEQLEGKSLRSALKSLDEILMKVNRGNGSLGALINDPALYDDAKALVGGANRNRIVRNLVRQTIKSNETQDVKDSKDERDAKERKAK
jgi:phospholipid/cholesterol/gamma-HCH transport system substrate-binding protein